MFYIEATKVSIETHNMLTPDEVNKLQELHTQLLRPALEIYRKDTDKRCKYKQSLKLIKKIFIISF